MGAHAFQRFGTKRRSLLRFAVRLESQCLQERRDPGQRLAEDERRARAGEHFLAQALALNGGGIRVKHGQRARIQLRGDRELG
ncbi:MAG: hypothetical protein WDO56_18105 [Gammaproteobacteria bacterium]